MNLMRPALPAVAAVFLMWAVEARADWAQSTDVMVVKASPANDEPQVQNPPSFTWSRHPSAPARYDFQILKSDGVTVALTGSTSRNWFLPTKALPAGTYFWKVRPAGTSLSAEFLVLFDVGCKNHRPVVTTSSTGVRTVTVGSQSFVLN